MEMTLQCRHAAYVFMNDCSKFYFQYAWREKQYGKWFVTYTFVMNEVFKKPNDKLVCECMC